MPSISKSWVSDHNDLSLLHITSDDPRRQGRVDLAYFDRAISERVAKLQWVIRRSEPYCLSERTNFTSYCSRLYGIGTQRYEPNEDYTSSNYCKRAGFTKEQFINTVVSQRGRLQRENFKYSDFKAYKLDDVIDVNVHVQCKRMMTIKILKRHVTMVPKKLFYSRVRGQLCLWPTKQQRQQRRPTSTLSYHILSQITTYITGCAYNRDPAHLDDYTIRADQSGFTYSTNTYNKYHEVAEGTVLEIGGCDGAYRSHWEQTDQTYRYPRGFLDVGVARRVYILVRNDVAELLKDTAHVSYNNYEALCGFDDHKQINLVRVCAEQYGMEIKELYVPSRLNKVYARSLEQGEKGYKTRARYENKVMSDARTNGRMSTKPRVYKFKKVYADTSIEVKLPDGSVVFALNCLQDAIVMGVKGRAKIRESSPLTLQEAEQMLSSYRELNKPLREDI